MNLQSLRNLLSRLIAKFIPFMVQRSFKQGMHAVWAEGWQSLPPGGAVLVANHHSWWDGYLFWLMRERLKRPMTVIMSEAQLKRFRFFRHLGVISDKDLREGIARLKAGHLLLIFPEAELRPAGPVKQLKSGPEFFAKHAQVPIVPVAMRVLMRSAQYPEAFVVFGPAYSETLVAEDRGIEQGLNALLYELDTKIAALPAETDPSDLVSWLKGRKSTSERMAWVEKLWS